LEILIEHYRLGMKLSMPVVFGDKVLMDSGSQIDTDRAMELICANGVKKLDVHKSHIPELAKKHPEFYGKHGDEIAKAKESGRIGRIQAANEWGEARKLNPKAPVVSLVARAQDLPDLKRVLVPYFGIEHETSRYRDISGSLSRSKMIVVWVDGFTKDELSFMNSDARKENPDIKLIAITALTYDGPWPTVRWLEHGTQVFKGVFLCFFTQYEKAFEHPLTGAYLPALKAPKIHWVTDPSSVHVLDQWLLRWEGLGAVVHDSSAMEPVSGAMLTIFYFKNEGANLAEKLKDIFLKNFNPQKVLIVIDHLSKEEVIELKSFGRLMLQMGGLGNDKLSGLIQKVLLSP
jgi:hypothetical protein